MRIGLYSAVILMLVVGFAGASSVSVFLGSYNVSASVVSSLSYVNISHAGGSYVLAYYQGEPTFLINTTGAYQFITQAQAIYSIINTTVLNASLSKINTTFLTSTLKKYNQSSASNVTDCFVETGLSSGETCTIQNSCQSCLTSEICRATLVGGTPLNRKYSPIGYNSTFEYGLINFEHNYTDLISSYSALISNASTLSASNAQSNINNIASAFSLYSSVTQNMDTNPIFPPPAGSDFSGCSPSLSAKNQPWYCSAVGLCQSLQYNVSLLDRMHGYINVMSSLPVSKAQIMAVAQNVSSRESVYVGAVLAAQKRAQLGAVMNTTLLGYNQTVANANLLLSRIYDSGLQQSINALQDSYQNLSANYLSVNISAYNTTLAAQYGTVKSQYASLNATYASLLNISQYNTLMLLDMQSGGSQPSSTTARLSFEQAQLGSSLNSRISNVNATRANLSALKGQIAASQPLPNVPQYLSRAIGAPVATALLSSTGYSAAVASAPFYAVIPSLVIGIIVLAVLLAYHRQLKGRHRLAVSRRTSRNWNILMGMAIAIVLLFIVATYLVAQSANTSAQLSVAAGAIKSSGSVAIVVSGQSNPAIAGCAAKIYSALASQGKNVSNATISAQSCSSGSGLQTVDSCMSAYASRGTPVIMLSNSTADSLTAYSYYGTVLRQSGTEQFTSQCLAYLFVK